MSVTRYDAMDSGFDLDNFARPEDAAATELSLLLLDHGMSARDVNGVVAEMRVLKADFDAGKMSESHFDRVAEIIIGTALARIRRTS